MTYVNQIIKNMEDSKIFEIDTLCAELEDVLHGEEGKKITQIRALLSSVTPLAVDNKVKSAEDWLKKEGYPQVMTMTLDNLKNILNRYASQSNSEVETNEISKLTPFGEWVKKEEWHLHSSNRYYYKSKDFHQWPPDQTADIDELFEMYKPSPPKQ